MTNPAIERRASMQDLSEHISDIESRLKQGDERMERIEADLAALKQRLDEVYEILAMAKGFFKVLGLIGTAVKWTSAVALAVAAAFNFYPKK